MECNGGCHSSPGGGPWTGAEADEAPMASDQRPKSSGVARRGPLLDRMVYNLGSETEGRKKVKSGVRQAVQLTTASPLRHLAV